MNTMDSTKGGIGVALAILGCILGLAGMYFGLSARNSQSAVATRVGDLETQVSALAAEDQRIAFQVRELGDQTRQALTDIAAKLPAKKAVVETSGTAKTGDDSKKAEPVVEGEYVIKAGDTFEKIAKAHNTTIEALQKANATVDPKKLQIGKKIKIQ
jgi:LysM repeat protein